MFYRGIAVATALLAVAVCGLFSGDVVADVPPSEEGAGVDASMGFNVGEPFPRINVYAGYGGTDGDLTYSAGIYIQYSPSRDSYGFMTLDENQFTIDRSLRSASVTAMINVLTCDRSLTPWACSPSTISIDLEWTANGPPSNVSPGSVKQQERGPPHCYEPVSHSIWRPALAIGTIAGELGDFSPSEPMLGRILRFSVHHADGATVC